MVMAGPLLETKLHVPRRRRGLVARPRLIERLSRASESKLTLVSAPAGFGKTTLVVEWLAAASADSRSPAWVSLDHGDNDPVVFWVYVVAALETAAPGVGAGALALLQSPQPPIDAVLAGLLNDLSASSDDVVLVLDDYHVIDARGVHDGMAFLVEHLPPQVQLVIAGRADPALPLARWRARRDPGRRPALHPRGDGGLPQRRDGTGAHGTGCCGAGGAHRRVGRRAPAGRAVAAGSRRCHRLHRRLRRGRPLHRRLPGRRGPAAPARARPALPAGDLHPEPPERLPVRRRHRPGRRQVEAGGARSSEPVSGPPRQPPRVVSVPPSLRRRAALAPAGRAARPGPGTPRAGERLV